MEATSLRFAAAARVLGQVARHEGLIVPGFCSPPRIVGVDRSIKRPRSGGVVVSVRIRSRPWVAVLADMVEGVVVANALLGSEAARLRMMLWSVIEEQLVPANPTLAVPSRGPLTPVGRTLVA